MGEGGSKKVLKDSMKLKWNFQRIVGLKLENDLQYGSGMDAIFSGTTQSSQNLLYRTISLI